MGKLETSGYKGWWPMKKITGRDAQGNFKYQEVYVNMARSREGQPCSRRFETYAPDEGWNGAPPYPTGEKPAHLKHGGGSEELWANLAAHKDDTKGTVILREPGRIVIRYQRACPRRKKCQPKAGRSKN